MVFQFGLFCLERQYVDCIQISIAANVEHMWPLFLPIKLIENADVTHEYL